jgi:hypothetical protein
MTTPTEFFRCFITDERTGKTSGDAIRDDVRARGRAGTGHQKMPASGVPVRHDPAP